jgi:capsular polysaccharide biosynthesis protein
MQLDLQQILNGLRKRWWLALLVMLSAAAVAYLYSNAQPPIYQAQVRIQAQPTSPSNDVSEYLRREIPASAPILTSKDFLRDVLDGKYGSAEPIRDVDVDALQGDIKVQPLPDDRAINMTVDYGDAATAQLLADRIADAFAARKNAETQDNPGGVRINWYKLQTPDLPSRPYQPRPLLTTAAAALFGLILGLLLAIGLELLDTTLKSPAEIRQYVGLNTLGIIPTGRSSGAVGAQRPANQQME